MNKQNKNPETPDEVTFLSPEEKLCNLVLDEWEQGQQYVSELNHLYDDIYSMIRGERPEKNYDWQSNVVINKVFQVVWTAIPYITQKIFGGSPVIGVRSFNTKGAWQREQILEFWHTMQATADKEHITYFLIVVMWLLRALLNGVGILKKGWHQKLTTKTIEFDVPTELGENGETLKSETHSKTYKIPVEDWPHNRIVNNRDIVVDWLLQPGQSIRSGRFIIERNILDLDYLHSSDINYKNLDQLEVTSTGVNTTTTEGHSEARSKDGLDTPPESDVYAEIEVFERIGKLPVYKEKQDGEWVVCMEKENLDSDDVVTKEMVVTVAKCQKKKVLIRCEPNTYGLKNYIDMHIYFDEERWQSMGMVEPVKDAQTALNDNINAAFDKIWQELMPPVIVNKFALWDWDTMQYAPQQRWLVGGNPADAAYFREPSRVTPDTWQKHVLFDNEIQLTTAITPPMQGGGKEKAATTNVLNAQMAAGRLDFIVKMIEQTALIPSAQMDVMFAKKFAHPMTLRSILGEPFEYGEWEEVYKYIPAASSVKLEQQKEIEIQQDLQLIQIIGSIPNPQTPKLLNIFLQNILRNRDMPKEAQLFDEDYFEPSSEAGNLQMMQRTLGPGTPSNQNQVPMSANERSTRQLTYESRGG